MLGAPHGRLAVDDDLTLQDAGDAAVEGLAVGGAILVVEEGVAVITADLADEFQHAHHGAVIEGDAVVVAFAQWEELRPAAVGVLGLEHVGQAAVEGFTISLGLRRVDHARHEAEFVDGAFVVERRLELGPVADVGLADRVGVLRPAARVGLIAQDDVGDLLGFRGGEPRVGFAQVASRAVVGRQARQHGQEREEEQGGAHGVVAVSAVSGWRLADGKVRGKN